MDFRSLPRASSERKWKCGTKNGACTGAYCVTGLPRRRSRCSARMPRYKTALTMSAPFLRDWYDDLGDLATRRLGWIDGLRGFILWAKLESEFFCRVKPFSTRDIVYCNGTDFWNSSRWWFSLGKLYHHLAPENSWSLLYNYSVYDWIFWIWQKKFYYMTKITLVSSNLLPRPKKLLNFFF